MARFAVAAGLYGTAIIPGHTADILNGSSMAAHQATFEAALATLVALGASPTQGAVTAVNDAYTTLKADFAATVPAATDDVVVSFDATTVVTKAKLRIVLDAIVRVVDGSNDLTP